MAVIRDNSQQTTANVMIVQGDGERKTVATASCHIRPGKGMSINVDILDDAATASENVADVTTSAQSAALTVLNGAMVSLAANGGYAALKRVLPGSDDAKNPREEEETPDA